MGLILARFLWPPAAPVIIDTAPPPNDTASAPTTPPPQAPTEAPPAGRGEQDLVLVAALYAVDGDLERARERLAPWAWNPKTLPSS
jgi:hypothetical protein